MYIYSKKEHASTRDPQSERQNRTHFVIGEADATHHFVGIDELLLQLLSRNRGLFGLFPFVGHLLGYLRDVGRSKTHVKE